MINIYVFEKGEGSPAMKLLVCTIKEEDRRRGAGGQT